MTTGGQFSERAQPEKGQVQEESRTGKEMETGSAYNKKSTCK
jgi:hypothetical protein